MDEQSGFSSVSERIFGDKIYNKKEPSLRSPFQIDRDRIIHSSAFRRLRNKTQVFGVYTLDYYRTRLTHSLEVSQIARSIASNINYKYGLNINIDLIEAISLAHDIGHPPFGHLGEEIIHIKLKMLSLGRYGFEANAQNIRILNFLEKKFYDIKNKRLCGLNLTFKTIDGILKYKLPFSLSDKSKHFIYDSDIFILLHLHGEDFIKYLEKESEMLNKKGMEVIKEYFFEATRSLECQILNAADDIAYATHDIEDGVESGLINIGSKEKLSLKIMNGAVKSSDAGFNTAQINNYDHDTVYFNGEDGERHDRCSAGDKVDNKVEDFFKNINNIFKTNDGAMPRLSIKIDLKEFFSNYISKFITNIDIEERSEFLNNAKAIKSSLQFSPVSKISDRSSGGACFNAGFVRGHLIIPGIDIKDKSYKYRLIWKNDVNMEIKALKQISYKLIMESRNIMLSRHKAKNILMGLFDVFSDPDNIKLYPEDFQETYENGFYDEYGKDDKIYIMCSDYISGMTDLYAVKLYSALFETGNIAGNIGTF